MRRKIIQIYVEWTEKKSRKKKWQENVAEFIYDGEKTVYCCGASDVGIFIQQQ